MNAKGFTLILVGVAISMWFSGFFVAKSSWFREKCTSCAEQVSAEKPVDEQPGIIAGADGNFAIIEKDRIIHSDGRVEKLVDGRIMEEAAERQRELDEQKHVDYLKNVCTDGLKGMPLFRLSTKGDLFFCSIHTTSDTEMRLVDTACYHAGGQVFGHTTGLDVLCDLSGVK